MNADVETTTPPVETPKPESTPPPVEDAGSIADHEKQFGPAAARARDEATGRFVKGETPQAQADQPVEKPAAAAKTATPKAQPPPAPAVAASVVAEEKPRRRETDVATPNDPPRIAQLTKQLRSEQRRREELEQRLRVGQPAPPSASAQPPSGNGHARPATPSEVWAFPKPEPTREQFAMADDPYAAWIEARQDWKFEKAEWDRDMRRQAETLTQQETEFVESIRSTAEQFFATNPEAQATIANASHLHEAALPPVAVAAIFQDDNPAQLVYDLARDVDLFDDFASWSEGKALTPAAVSQLRRRLDRYRRGLDRAATPSAATASVAPPPVVTVVPTPPKAVRGGPMKPGAEPPGDGASIADHARFYAPKGRR